MRESVAGVCQAQRVQQAAQAAGELHGAVQKQGSIGVAHTTAGVWAPPTGTGTGTVGAAYDMVVGTAGALSGVVTRCGLRGRLRVCGAGRRA